MRLRFQHLLRHFSRSSPSPKNLLRNVPYYHRHTSLIAAQEALSDYLHTTRSVPPSVADLIASHSPISLTSLISSLPFHSASLFRSSLRRLLYFRSINELDFFFESIGIFPRPPKRTSHFLSDEPLLLPSALSLLFFGFPWTTLGVLYLHSSAFSLPAGTLSRKLSSLANSGLDRACVVGICLAFPVVFEYPDDKVELLLEDMRHLFGKFEPCGSVEDDVEVPTRFCKRVRMVYDMGCGWGQLPEFLDKWQEVFLRSEDVDPESTARFLCRLGMEEEETRGLILQHPELLRLDVNNRDIWMPEYLNRVGIGKKELDKACARHPYVLGRNKLVNLPGCLRALGYDKWLLGMVRQGDFEYLSPEFLDAANGDGNEMDAEFERGFESVKAARVESFLVPKMEFLHGLGFGRNDLTVRALRLVNGTLKDLKERFEFLLDMGIDYSNLCKMISACPKILNHGPNVLRKKIEFLCNDLGYTVHYLYNFPGYICFDLENRIKPRYKMIEWLRTSGLLKKSFSPSTIISVSEKKYISYLKECHPAAPKLWFEVFKI